MLHRDTVREIITSAPDPNNCEIRNIQMLDDERKDLIEKWQILGLSLMMLSKTQEDFYRLVSQEFGYAWDGQGWIKNVSYQ